MTKKAAQKPAQADRQAQPGISSESVLGLQRLIRALANPRPLPIAGRMALVADAMEKTANTQSAEILQHGRRMAYLQDHMRQLELLQITLIAEIAAELATKNEE